MKKITVSLLFVVISMAGYGQFTKGTIMAGGTFGAQFNTEKYRTGNTTTVTGHTTSVDVSPTAGYFIIENLAVGAGVNMNASRYKSSNGNSTASSHGASFSPFVRYYYQRFYGQGAFQLGSGKTKYLADGFTNESTYTISGWSLAAGYAYMLNQNVAIEPQIGYGSTGNKSGDSKDITSGLFLRIGFQIYLTKQ